MSEGKISESSLVRICRRLRMQWEEAQESYVLLYPEGMIKLNESAGEIFKRIDGAKSVAEIIADLQGAYPDIDLKEDVLAFLRVANEHGWIECA